MKNFKSFDEFLNERNNEFLNESKWDYEYKGKLKVDEKHLKDIESLLLKLYGEGKFGMGVGGDGIYLDIVLSSGRKNRRLMKELEKIVEPFGGTIRSYPEKTSGWSIDSGRKDPKAGYYNGHDLRPDAYLGTYELSMYIPDK